jgi:hypothetical protein
LTTLEAKSKEIAVSTGTVLSGLQESSQGVLKKGIEGQANTVANFKGISIFGTARALLNSAGEALINAASSLPSE